MSGTETTNIISTNTEGTTNLFIGRYVQYKNETYIVTQFNPNGTFQIYNPVKTGKSSKLSVSAIKLTALNAKAEMVLYLDALYLVTPKKNIISLITNKIMNWADDHLSRISILNLTTTK